MGLEGKMAAKGSIYPTTTRSLWAEKWVPEVHNQLLPIRIR